MTHNRRYFGTDGIRGIANQHPMTGEVAMALGRAVTRVARRRSGRRAPKVVIGKDTRLSGYMLETAITSGICSMGGAVMLVGPMPTPGISFITNSMRADAGIVISASHNPYCDNGIKLFGADGFKFPDEMEAEIEALMDTDNGLSTTPPSGDAIGRTWRIDDAVGRYIVALKHTFPRALTLEGVHLVVDCAHGAAYKTAPYVFEELGAKVTALGVSPNGLNINADCGALHPAHAAAEVVRLGAHMGIALDGDADRLILIDEKGQIVDGDAVMALCASHMIQEKTLHKKTVVTTIMSNLGLDHAIAAMGGKVIRVSVGDRYVVEKMRRGRYNFGGEQSGHLIFLDHATTGDGILAALQVLALVIRAGKPLSELAHGIMQRVPQCLLSFDVPRKVPLQQLPKVQACIRDVEAKLASKGRVLVRYSGTETKMRVLVEGPDPIFIERQAARIRDAFIDSISGK
ncbi:MAG: phosphoglucosamine mutase [Myxococcales bacterium]|jgi:phosphoglucosamine mutase|nr:phosphoglucosamine mutase [Myxococcales bacterium]